MKFEVCCCSGDVRSSKNLLRNLKLCCCEFSCLSSLKLKSSYLEINEYVYVAWYVLRPKLNNLN
jgi:hypothetical protein